MPYDIEDDVLIDAPPETVWRWTVEDVERERSWRNIDGKGVQSLERLDDGPLEVGSRFRGTVKVGPGEPQAYVNVVTELDHLKRIGWETVDADGPLGGNGRYELEPEGDDKTRFKIYLNYPPRTFVGRLQRPLVVLMGGRYAMPRMLAKLKRQVEADTEPA